MEKILEKAVALRKLLHQNPDPSLHEERTRKIIKDFLLENTDLEVVDNGSWLYAVSHGDDSNPIAYRADHDAVLGQDGKVSHRCGHDGHTATLCAFALYCSQNKPERTVYFIFQPAEEIGEGGKFCAPLIKEKGIQEVYGYHNLPGFPYKNVILRHHTFACASTGLKIHILGTVAHAAYPETGKNPAFIIAQLIKDIDAEVKKPHRGVVQNAVIGVDVGSNAYGVSAFEGELRLTVRGEYQDEFDALVSMIENETKQLCAEGGFSYTIEEIERFPSTDNDPINVEKVKQAAEENGYSTLESEEPIRWSDDFAYYLHNCPGCYFGIGDGESYPQVHTISYEYPDDIMIVPLSVYISLLNK